MKLIDANALMRDIENYHLSDGKFQHWVEVQPTIDAAKVVHCKDCKYWHYYGNGYHFCDVFLLAGEYDADSYDSSPDDFCSRGVMRDETD